MMAKMGFDVPGHASRRPPVIMASEQSFWNSAKSFFSFSTLEVCPRPKEGDRKEASARANSEKERYRPAKVVNADNTYVYDFGSLNMP
ncbi:hypothetical protein NECAME_08904 [Necator americanus]|uniref:Uncharacterized protein n=1 Tax=Necator americanus TaxID=51031 RepID=W2TII7_NECAM|nr:hypothetical protein NECAME_08904 [Necator americanus]ETN80827.1 hypothetical protein NECAME_08904 [Necator americanus]